MLDIQDIQKLTELLATKSDVHLMTEDLVEIKLSVRNLITATDGIVTRLEALNQEYLVLKERDSRYERWFHEIAEKVGISLVP
jgi:hypothetical protein